METQLQLVQAMAWIVRGILNDAMVKECNGCLVNHPSQIHPECQWGGSDKILFGSCLTFCGLVGNETGILEPHHLGSNGLAKPRLG